MHYGYARVSTVEQDTQLQLDALDKAGAEVVFSEKTSSVGKRPQLRKLLQTVQRGDHISVYKLDRLARSLSDLLNILETLEKRGVTIKSLTEPIDTDNYLGRFLLQILGAVAELERNLIRERSIAGQRAARARGAKVGRPGTIPDADVIKISALFWHKGMTKAALSRLYGVSDSAMKRYFQKHKITACDVKATTKV